jgi:hypothetical protein
MHRGEAGLRHRRSPLLLLLLGLFPSVLRCLVMTNHAAGTGAENAMMASKMTSDTPDNRTL